MNERIVFLGTPEISAICLEGLIKAGRNIVGVVTKEDKEKGRNKVREESPVSQIANQYHIPLHKPHKLNNDYEIVKEWKPDLLLTFAFGQILSETVLSLGKYKPLNLHGSLLPKYRGAAPMQYALLNGDKETGVTLRERVKERDAGDRYGTKVIPLTEKDNYSSLCKKMANAALELAVEKLPLYFEGKLKPVKQDPSLVTFTHRIKKEDEHLSLDCSSEEFVNHVRALSLTPGGYLLLENQPIKIYEAEKYNDEKTREAGTIVLAHKKDIILQLTKGQVRLTLLQRPGKKRRSAQDFNNGVRDFQGKVLK